MTHVFQKKLGHTFCTRVLRDFQEIRHTVSWDSDTWRKKHSYNFLHVAEHAVYNNSALSIEKTATEITGE